MPETQSTRRLHWLLWMMLAWAGVIFGRLIWLQVVTHDELARLAAQQQTRMKEIPALRGSILDRSGQPLAKSMPAESVCVNPQRISDPGMAADLLSQVLDMDRNSLLEKIVSSRRRNSGFLWIKRKVMPDEAERLRSLKLEWVEFRPEMLRFYPHHQLASHVIGSIGIVDSEDTIERGTAGIESSFEDDLAGQPGLARVLTDVKQNAYDAVVTRKPEPGANLTLTIDPNLQYDAEKQLAKAMLTSGAKTGSIVVMNPYNGEVLAMANYPTFDPNNPPGVIEPEGARSNLAVTTPFEPGSVYKVITLSTGLDTRKVTPDTMINCGNGIINLFGRVIHDTHRYGALSAQQVFEKSSNIGAIQIGLRVGDQKMYDYSRKFGIGHKTGIELPGESSGMLRRVNDWQASSIGSVAMGHEVSATSIQLAVAASVIANGGLVVKPTIVLSRQKPGGPLEKFAPTKPTRIIRPETAITMRQLMEGVVLRGTGRNLANLKGYTSGGKTGTAQVYDLKAHVYTHKYNASFVGFAPVVNPQIVVAVTLNNTGGGTAGYGGPVAAPVFREIATSALRMLDVPKDLPDNLVRTAKGPVDHDDLAIAGLGEPLEAIGSQAVSSVTLPPASADTSSDASDAGRRPFLATNVTGPKVPDFQGMTLRAVLEESSARGLLVETLGSPNIGLVRNQDPPAGTILRPEMRVRVQFAK